MKRIYVDNGQGISTKIICKIDGKKYIISTAKDPHGFWQLAIFRIIFEIPFLYAKADLTNGYPGSISKTFEEAEKIHYKVEELVTNHSSETWLSTMAEWSLSEEHENIEKTYTTTDYIKDLEQSALEQKENMQKIWSEFQVKPDNENTLKEKAKVLAQVILQIVRTHTEMFFGFGNMIKDSDGKYYNEKGEFVSLGELFIEIASVYLLVIDRFTFSVFSKENRDLFINTFQEEFIASALLEIYKENADLMENAFISDLNKCLEKYDSLPLYSQENKGPKDTVLWKFAGKIAKMAGKEKHILFIELIMNTVLRDIDILQLDKLFSKEK
jgi:hypothetical protein